MGSGPSCEHFAQSLASHLRPWHISTMLSANKSWASYRVSAGVRIIRSETGGVVLDMDRGKVFRLNRVGALIFERLGERHDENQISKELSQQFNIPVRAIHSDVVAFLKSLESQGLVRMAQGASHDTQAG